MATGIHHVREALGVAVQAEIERNPWSRLPEECAAIGLPLVPKIENDAKSRFLKRCVDALSDADVLVVATTYVERYPFARGHRASYALEEKVWERDERFGLNKRVRREIARAIQPDELLLQGEPFLDLVRSLFWFSIDLAALWLPTDDDGVAEIEQHVVRNPGDWTTEFTFGKLGAYDVSESRFVRFIEGLLGADVRPDEASIRAFALAINGALTDAPCELREVGVADGYPLFRFALRGPTAGRPKNIIFASSRKPDIRFRDAVNNDIEIASDPDAVLVYDRAVGPHGLLWRDLQSWHAETLGIPDDDGAKVRLYRRLLQSLPDSSPPQRSFFAWFYARAGTEAAPHLPALLPEVWLHWDPRTVKERGTNALLRFRMDFLMLLPGDVRIVIEVDGRQHYANDRGVADTAAYARMAAADRDLRLSGYEVYHFGAAELLDESAEARVRDFFDRLFTRHGVRPASR